VLPAYDLAIVYRAAYSIRGAGSERSVDCWLVLARGGFSNFRLAAPISQAHWRDAFADGSRAQHYCAAMLPLRGRYRLA
jgi:hypothetical protein